MSDVSNCIAQIKRSRLRLAVAVAISTLPAAAMAQTAKSDSSSTTETSPVEEVVVTGIRASLASAIENKQTASQIVDSIVAEDIGKLPDNNVAEALQRITGVQISRSRGEGDRVQIRGLSLTQTRVIGRSIFTAG